MERFNLLIISLLSIFVFSCEQEIKVDIPEVESQLVFEGYIDIGLPPLVMLSRSQSYFASTNLKSIENSFVHDAIITIENNGEIDTLFEIGTDTLFYYLKFIEDSLGVELDLGFLPLDEEGNPLIEIFVYTSLNTIGLPNQRYNMKTTVENKYLQATTTIPNPVYLDTLWTEPHPDPLEDSLKLLRTIFSDPPNQRNYYRLFTSTNQDLFYTVRGKSIWDDHTLANVDGKSFDVSIDPGINPYEEIIDRSDYSYFTKGDTVIVKWSSIDKQHADFHQSIEFSRLNSGNPFGRPVTIQTNIEGGYGIWGGYASTYYPIVIQ